MRRRRTTTARAVSSRLVGLLVVLALVLLYVFVLSRGALP